MRESRNFQMAAETLGAHRSPMPSNELSHVNFIMTSLQNYVKMLIYCMTELCCSKVKKSKKDVRIASLYRVTGNKWLTAATVQLIFCYYLRKICQL